MSYDCHSAIWLAMIDTQCGEKAVQPILHDTFFLFRVRGAGMRDSGASRLWLQLYVYLLVLPSLLTSSVALYAYVLLYHRAVAGQSFSQPSYVCITEIISGINFHPCGKDCHRTYVIIKTGQKISRLKVSPMRAGGKKGDDFLQAKLLLYCIIAMNCIIHEPFRWAGRVSMGQKTFLTYQC